MKRSRPTAGFGRLRGPLYCVVILLTLSVLLVGCGDNTPTPPLTTVAPTSRVATTTAPTSALPVPAPTVAPYSGPPVTIRIATGDSGDGLIPYNKIKADFEKANPNIKIQIEPVTDSDYYGFLLGQVASGKGPDLILVGDDAVAQFAKKAIFDDLTPYIEGANGNEKLDVSIYYPGVFQAGTFQGKPFLLTKDFTPIGVLYNRALFKAAQLPEPGPDWNWDEFLATAQKLTLKDASGKVTQYGVQLPGAWPRGFEAIAFSYGAKLISNDGTKYSGFLDSEASVKAMQFYADLYNKGIAAPPNDLSKFLSGNENFGQGTAAMQIVGRWPQTNYLKNPKLVENLGLIGLPKGTLKANAIAWSGFGINAKGSNKAVAWRVLRYFAGPEGAKTWVDWGLTSVQSVTGQSKVLLDRIWFDQIQFFKPLTANYTPYWNEVGSPEISAVMQTVLTDPKADVAQLLKEAAAKADKKLKEKLDTEK